MLTEISPLSHHTIKWSTLLISKYQSIEENCFQHSGFVLTLHSPISFRNIGPSFRGQIALKN